MKAPAAKPAGAIKDAFEGAEELKSTKASAWSARTFDESLDVQLSGLVLVKDVEQLLRLRCRKLKLAELGFHFRPAAFQRNAAILQHVSRWLVHSMIDTRV